MKLTPLPPLPRLGRRDLDFRFRAHKSRRITKMNIKKVDRFMKALWTLDKEIKTLLQEQDDNPATADSSNNEG